MQIFMNGKLNKRIMLKVISVREEKDYLKQAIAFLQESWSEVSTIIY